MLVNIMCPICKDEFPIDWHKEHYTTPGLVVFRRRLVYIGKHFHSIRELVEHLKDLFHQHKRLERDNLLAQLQEQFNIPYPDADYILEKLKLEGCMYEPQEGWMEWLE